MDRVKGGIQIQDNLFRRGAIRVLKQVDNKRSIDPSSCANLGSRAGLARRRSDRFRVDTGHRRAVRPIDFQLAYVRCRHRAMPKFIMVIPILITKPNTKNPLPDQGHHRELKKPQIPPIRKTFGQSLCHPERPLRLSQQEHPAIRLHHPAVTSSRYGLLFNIWKSETFAAPFYRH
jgi:hypothetical protein